jgi:hypothetical protein
MEEGNGSFRLRKQALGWALAKGKADRQGWKLDFVGSRVSFVMGLHSPVQPSGLWHVLCGVPSRQSMEKHGENMEAPGVRTLGLP